MKDLSKQEDDLKHKIKLNSSREKIVYKPNIT